MKPQQKAASADATTPQSSSRLNAIALLKADHRKVNALFRQYKSAAAEEKSGLARQICTELIVHTQLEEEIFYAACRSAGVEEAALDEAQVEHDSAKVLMAGLLHNAPDSPFQDARMAVLAEHIRHHIGEEEKAGSGIFARARAARMDMNALGLRLQERKAELMAQAGNGELDPSAPGSLELQTLNRGKQEQFTMARQYDRSRDEQGRFTDDEDRGGRYSQRSGGNERDERGRFMSDEDERGGRGYSQRSGGMERDERGRFMSDDERSGGRSWRDEQSGYSSRDPGGRERGWIGDREGQSRPSGEGWESRGGGRSGSSRYEEEERGDRGYSARTGERDDRGRFMSEDERSWGRSSREDDARYSPRGEEGRDRGWSGDSQGHARASDEGWEDRGRARSSREEDDYRGRGSQQGRGHGGWFGDSRGHAEASRRGWQHR